MVTKMDIKRFALFIRFLKERNVYTQFLIKYNADNSRKWRERVNYEYASIIDVLEKSFPWDYDGYWSTVDTDWRRYVCRKRIDKYYDFNLTKFIY